MRKVICLVESERENSSLIISGTGLSMPAVFLFVYLHQCSEAVLHTFVYKYQ